MKRNITISLEKAREWYNSDNDSLKEIALQAFSKYELESGYTQIRTFRAACDALELDYNVINIYTNTIAKYSKASAAMFKVNIIRKALNLGQNLQLTKNLENFRIYYPYNPFITEDSTYYEGELNSGIVEVIGKIRSGGTIYNVLSSPACKSGFAGLGYFFFDGGIGYADSSTGFLGCATKEIAEHFGKYFGMLITEAKYADMVDFEVIENKYQ